MTFIFCATMYPKLSELWGENTTVGPTFFNRWLAPIGLVIFLLMGLAPLFGWRPREFFAADPAELERPDVALPSS